MSQNIYLIILVAMVATQISRLAPMFISSRFKMSEGFEAWLKYIPVSVLTALIIPEFFTKTENGFYQMNYVYLICGLIALSVGLWKKNMLLSTVCGVATLAILRLVV